MKNIYFLGCFLIFSAYSHQTLSAIAPSYYDLQLTVLPAEKALIGSNKIYLKRGTTDSIISINLYDHFTVDSVRANGKSVNFEHTSNIIELANDTKSIVNLIDVYYHGKPIVAKNAPWEGGFVWETTNDSTPWIATACQNLGASSWWPCIDKTRAEPDSMQISISFPNIYKELYAVSNGNLVNSFSNAEFRTFVWKVHYPINLYNVCLNIGNYAHINDYYSSSTSDSLNLSYYVLKKNVQNALTHFEQVKTILGVFEELYGPYPFPKDGYALVETPFWGMEHQSAIAYGNNFKNNDFGFDFIILHESAHEYWGNSISCSNEYELWIHETFATYTESLFVERIKGKFSAIEYLARQRPKIKNSEPMLFSGETVTENLYKSSDIYYKGAWVMHTCRGIVNNDSIWFRALRKTYEDLAGKYASTELVINKLCKHTGKDLYSLFKFYLNNLQIPEIAYYLEKKSKKYTLHYRCENCSKNMIFELPFADTVTKEKELLTVSDKWLFYELKKKQKLIPDFHNLLIDAHETKFANY